MNHSLEIKELKKSFQDFKAVDGVDFYVEEGKFFSILGPSGCGKTTLLRMIAGFLEPTSGSIKIRGDEMIGISPNKRPVNLVFQNLALFPMMDVGENIAFGLKRQNCSKSEIEEKVKNILEKVHLGGYERKNVSDLSGGQKQRVAIARSLVLEPSILLLDEPLGALDLKLREQMKIELKKLQHEFGTTFIYITHDQSEALVMSDKVAVMNNGKFEQIDTPENLYANPKTSFVASFVGETNIFEARLNEDRKSVLTKEGMNFKVFLVDEKIQTFCKLFIRPEAVVLLVDDGMEDMNYFDLTIKTILFDGSNTKVLANVDKSDHEIMVSLPQNRRFAHIKEGEVVRAGVHVSDCKCYE
ncbi:ABC transporter ATP-binding protein [Sulfurospirillum arcachonense]|uniref:ABC transporter ATP-binding protein n=1 Tax=Sulfurospirillum arcachonense TaxID=57666 RepID=UPI000467F505|nr:ABC transporter ATP-binding protein [Sulfurospirillum arcachonense]